MIREPIKVHPDQKIGDVLNLIEEKKFTFSTFPVVDETGRLLGLLPGHCVRARFASRGVGEAMVKRPSVLTIREDELEEIPSQGRILFSPRTSAFTNSSLWIKKII